MVGVVCGAVYFQEYSAFHPVWFPIGCLLEVSGILALAWKAEDNGGGGITKSKTKISPSKVSLLDTDGEKNTGQAKNTSNELTYVVPK